MVKWNWVGWGRGGKVELDGGDGGMGVAVLWCTL